jgi:hypothetical protein
MLFLLEDRLFIVSAVKEMVPAASEQLKPITCGVSGI